MAWRYDFEFARPPTVGERRGRAAWAAESLRAEGKALEPVAIAGTKIAETFWGKAWCQHIETYSDFANRLPRGRSYVRSGTVIDLKLEPGKVRALVQGSELYEVELDIEPLAADRWTTLVRHCSGQIDSVISLLGGKLSDHVMTALCDREKGLFPGSRQLSMSCSCPDSAVLCKHLAAVLYGIGARLDTKPELFFLLRGVDQMDLVSEAGSSAGSGPEEVPREDLAEIFGIELATTTQKKRRARARKPKPGTRRAKNR